MDEGEEEEEKGEDDEACPSLITTRATPTFCLFFLYEGTINGESQKRMLSHRDRIGEYNGVARGRNELEHIYAKFLYMAARVPYFKLIVSYRGIPGA